MPLTWERAVLPGPPPNQAETQQPPQLPTCSPTIITSIAAQEKCIWSPKDKFTMWSTDESPRLLSASNGTTSPRHLIMMHNLTSRAYDIEGPVAKLSLYNLKDVTVSLGPDARILSSTLEITKCERLSVTFQTPSAVPAIIQLDPALEDVSFEFQGDAQPWTFIVSPRMSQDTSGGLSGIRVGMGGKAFELVDARGGIHQELLRSSGGRTSDQYTITCTTSEAVEGDKNEKKWVWSMKPVDKIAGGVPIVGGH